MWIACPIFHVIKLIDIESILEFLLQKMLGLNFSLTYLLGSNFSMGFQFKLIQFKVFFVISWSFLLEIIYGTVREVWHRRCPSGYYFFFTINLRYRKCLLFYYLCWNIVVNWLQLCNRKMKNFLPLQCSFLHFSNTLSLVILHPLVLIIGMISFFLFSFSFIFPVERINLFNKFEKLVQILFTGFKLFFCGVTIG